MAILVLEAAPLIVYILEKLEECHMVFISPGKLVTVANLQDCNFMNKICISSSLAKANYKLQGTLQNKITKKH